MVFRFLLRVIATGLVTLGYQNLDPASSSTSSITPYRPSPNVNGDSEPKMVCYYGTWAVYRPGQGKFDVPDIDPYSCTHFMYGFAKLENNHIVSFDPWRDLPDDGGYGGYQKFVGLRSVNPKAKFLIAIGGWNEGSTKYSQMANDPSARKTFITSVVSFLQRYKFDGIDLDWEYPAARGGVPSDRDAFTALVQELHDALSPQGFLLTTAVSPNLETAAAAYDIPAISKHLDFINVMGYDYHGYWEGHLFTGHNTPLYEHPLDAEHGSKDFNVNATVHYYLKAGLPKEKLILGMGLYGRGFTLDDESKNGLYDPASQPIPAGPYTRQDGFWGYNEICEVYSKEMSQWRLVIDQHVKAPYGFYGKKWIGYEDVESLYYKAKYARDMGLGGGMAWSIETDDFRGTCHGEKFILVNTIYKTLKGGSKPTIPQRPKVVTPTVNFAQHENRQVNGYQGPGSSYYGYLNRGRQFA